MQIDKITRAFIWGGWEGKNNMHLVAWSEVCRRLSRLSSVGRSCNIGMIFRPKLRINMSEPLIWLVGDGRIIRFWADPWLVDHPLVDEVQITINEPDMDLVIMTF
ncbi:hypothetical protein V2J09_017034 [Rumex salicifolius]